jgi:hypothetical protein
MPERVVIQPVRVNLHSIFWSTACYRILSAMATVSKVVLARVSAKKLWLGRSSWTFLVSVIRYNLAFAMAMVFAKQVFNDYLTV